MSASTLSQILGLKAGTRLYIANPPNDLEHILGVLPRGLVLLGDAKGPVDVILLFAAHRAMLEKQLPLLQRQLHAGGQLWVVFGRRYGPAASDLQRNGIRAYGMSQGLQPGVTRALDEARSLLCLRRP